MELDLFSVIPSSASLLGVAATRIGEHFVLSGGFEQFPSTNFFQSQTIENKPLALSSFSASIDNITLPGVSGLKSTHASLKKLPLSQQKPSTYLQVRLLHIPTATWSPNIIVSNGLLNRAYHASATIRDEVFLFGGVSRSAIGGSGCVTSLEPCSDVVRIRKGTFGYKSSTLPLDEYQHVVKSAAMMGLSANTCGQEQDCVVLFGGYQMPSNGGHHGVYSNNVYIFRAVEEKEKTDSSSSPVSGPTSPRQNMKQQPKKIQYIMKQVEVDANCATPPPRAFHSATLITPNSSNPNQAFLVVFGGETEGKHTLNDMWILDLTEVLTAEYKAPEAPAPVVDTKPAKGGKASKNEPVVPVKTNAATWTKISLSSNTSSSVILSRCKHNAFHVRNPNVFYHPHGQPSDGEHANQESSGNKQYDYIVFGGLSTKGPLPLAEYTSFSIEFDSSSNKLAVTLTGTNHDIQTIEQDSEATLKQYMKTFPASINMKNLTPPLLKALLTATQGQHTETIYGSAIGMVYDQDFNSQRDDQLMDEHERISVGLLVFGGCKTMGSNNKVTDPSGKSHPTHARNHSSDGYLTSFDTTFLITTATKDPVRASFDEPISIYKRIRRIVLKAHEHIEGMRVPNDQEVNKLNYLKQKTIRYSNGDVYFGEVIKFKPRSQPIESTEPEVNGDEEMKVSPRCYKVDSMSITESSIGESKGSPAYGPGHGGGGGSLMAGSISRPRTRESWHDDRHKGPYHHMDIDDGNSVGTLDVDNPEGVPGVHVPHGQGKMSYANGDLYEGAWHEGERHGQGMLTLFIEQNPKLSTSYEGEFVYDQRTGQGKMISYTPFSTTTSPNSGSSSKTSRGGVIGGGSQNNNNPNEQQWIKSTYSGSFLNGLYHGYGELTLEDDSDTLIYHRIFKGQFVHHRKHGLGKVFTIHHKLQLHESSKLPKDQESIVEGEWKDDKMIGFGQAKHFLIQSLNVAMGYLPGENISSFQMVEHHFSANIMKMTHIREEKLWLFGMYTGTLVPSLDHTISLLSPIALIPYAEKAICSYEDGSSYEGSWKTGRRNGYGSYYFANGNKYDGKWVGDKRCGYGRLMELLPADASHMTHRDDVMIEGERGAGTQSIISDIDEHGRQYITLYEGQWEENAQHGEGILYNREQQNYYQGQFVHGLKQGNGRYHDLETNKVLEETTFAHDHAATVSKHLGRTTTI